MKPIVDPVFRTLIPPLEPEEYSQLEESLLSEGCRDALVVWNGVLLDGHNRYEICQKHNLPFQTVERTCADRSDAKMWIIKNQLGRRNIPAYESAKLALQLKGLIAVRAKSNQGQRNDLCQNSDESSPSNWESNTFTNIGRSEPTDTKKELAKLAGVSHDTIHKVETIERDGPAPVREAAKNNLISINRAHEITKAVKALPEQEREQAAIRLLERRDDEETVREDRRYKLKKALINAVVGMSTVPVDDESFDAWLEGMDSDDVDFYMSCVQSAVEKLQDLKRRFASRKTIRIVR